MPAVFGRRRRRFAVLAWTFLAMALTAAMPAARAETVTVTVDEAHIMKMPDRVATIVIGNPLVADATLQAGGILVITGKGFGSTNLLGLDRTGQVVMDKTVQVLGPSSNDIVVVYRGVERESYSCAPECEHRLTLGDSTNYFNQILSQAGTRTGQAQKAPPR
ncbi:MAG TPA: pilus assembly protein N-terminal domain-containing protein [Pseudolabrys sp.]|nr:pilus assembly protein N-terminal domain-containing protein [Pseudolabrys sp.]